jgi:hypothetical protein
LVVVSHAQIAYELVASRRSILYTYRGILAVALSRTGVVSEQRLVSLGMMRQAKLFAHNNFLNDDSLSTPVRYLLPLPSLVLADALRALHSFVRSFVRSFVSTRMCVPFNAVECSTLYSNAAGSITRVSRPGKGQRGQSGG